MQSPIEWVWAWGGWEGRLGGGVWEGAGVFGDYWMVCGIFFGELVQVFGLGCQLQCGVVVLRVYEWEAVVFAARRGIALEVDFLFGVE